MFNYVRHNVALNKFDLLCSACVLADNLLFRTFIGRRGKKLKLFAKNSGTPSETLRYQPDSAVSLVIITVILIIGTVAYQETRIFGINWYYLYFQYYRTCDLG